jgi:tetratricopeptide (TPR) repeat protein
MNNLASTYSSFGRHDEALELLQETLAFRQRVLPENHPDIASSMGNLASTYSALGKTMKALSFFKEALAILDASLPATHGKIASTLASIACIYVARSNHAKALEFQVRLLSVHEKTLAPGDPAGVASVLAVCRSYEKFRRWADAEAACKAALLQLIRTVGLAHPTTTTLKAKLKEIRSHLD